jgi:parallel beta-helix repeat protein
VVIDGDHALIADNKIDNFGNDAIDLVASNVTIRNNTIMNGHHTTSEPLHADGIQGWTQNDAINKDVVIDGNMIIKTGDPKVSQMQGISIFDGKWDGLTISNNVVVTNVWHGIAVYGATNARIINNTVVAYDPVNHPTWIIIKNAKNGRLSHNVVVRNNITEVLTYVLDATVAVDHNIVASKITRIDTLGAATNWSKPGNYGDHNVIDPNIYRSLVMVDNAKGLYDLRLKPYSRAIGTGSSVLAPEIDILGKRRTAPVDVGAYTH